MDELQSSGGSPLLLGLKLPPRDRSPSRPAAHKSVPRQYRTYKLPEEEVDAYSLNSLEEVVAMKRPDSRGTNPRGADSLNCTVDLTLWVASPSQYPSGMAARGFALGEYVWHTLSNMFAFLGEEYKGRAPAD